MKKIRPKKRKIIIVSLFLIILFLLVVTLSFAWFTKSSDDDIDLNFGVVSISCDGGEDGKIVEFKIFNGNNGTEQSFALPGDVIKSNFRIINTGSVACFYLIKVECDDQNLNSLNSFYCFDGNNLIKTDEENINLSKLAVGENHKINFSTKIDENYTFQNSSTNLKLKVVAIQQRNLTENMAYLELINLK